MIFNVDGVTVTATELVVPTRAICRLALVGQGAAAGFAVGVGVAPGATTVGVAVGVAVTVAVAVAAGCAAICARISPPAFADVCTFTYRPEVLSALTKPVQLPASEPTKSAGRACPRH